MIRKTFIFSRKNADQELRNMTVFGWETEKAVQKGQKVYAIMRWPDHYAKNKDLKALYQTYRAVRGRFPLAATIVTGSGLFLTIIGLFLPDIWRVIFLVFGIVLLFIGAFMYLSFLLIVKERKTVTNEALSEAQEITNVK